jgi:hypothetical protein
LWAAAVLVVTGAAYRPSGCLGSADAPARFGAPLGRWAPELVSTVLAAVEGTMLIWAIAPRGDIKARIAEAVQVALGRGGR